MRVLVINQDIRYRNARARDELGWADARTAAVLEDDDA